MACDELLIHTDDAGRGLGLVFTPDAALCARVLAHLFPEAPGDVRGALGRAAMGEWTDRAAWVAAPHGVALDLCAAPTMVARLIGHVAAVDALSPGFAPRRHAHYTPCSCGAYAWPHRPGNGLCCWPRLPLYQCTTVAGTHRWPRRRARRGWAQPGRTVRDSWG